MYQHKCIDKSKLEALEQSPYRPKTISAIAALVVAAYPITVGVYLPEQVLSCAGSTCLLNSARYSRYFEP